MKDQSPSEVDLFGNASYPAVYYFEDENFLYLRERIVGDPRKAGGYVEKAWVVLLEQTGDNYYEYLLSLDGNNEMVEIWNNTVQSSIIDFSPVFGDDAEILVWNGSASIYASADDDGTDHWFISWAIPKNINGFVLSGTRTLYYATSAQGSNFNKDFMNCYVQPSCGNGTVEPSEQCEPPGDINNTNCTQSTQECEVSGFRTGTRDGYGNCNSICGCSYDPFVYQCVDGQCGAECDSNDDCSGDSCSVTYNDFCTDYELTEYDDDKILDSTTVSNSCSDTCQSDCTCTDCTADCSAPSTNIYCVQGVCDAECEENNDCSCPVDGCVGLDYYDYPNYGSCTGCLCDIGTSIGEGCEPNIYVMDNRCYECLTDADCNYLDEAYCNGDIATQIEGVCNNYVCEKSTPAEEDCGIDYDFCEDDGNVWHHDGYCTESHGADCTATEQKIITCSDGLWCNGAESCQETGPTTAQCVNGVPVNCDDSVDCTTDSCIESTTSCDHTPNDAYCDNGLWCDGLEYCDITLDCQSGTAPDCSDDLFCTVNEMCDETSDSCVSDPRDCSGFNIGAIGICTNDPDGNRFTWDSRDAFTSECDEAAKECTVGSETVTSVCDVDDCGAQCDSNDDCSPSTCSVTYDDYCDDKKLTEYDDDKTMDSTTVSASNPNTCDMSSCFCTDNSPSCPPPSTNTYCVFGLCGATCDSSDDCQEKCVGEVYYYNGDCDLETSCSCSWTQQDCDLEDGCYVYGTGCEDRNYFCDVGGCDYDPSASVTYREEDRYGPYVQYCSGDEIRVHNEFHDFYCDDSCLDHTSWQNDSLVTDCSVMNGWYLVESTENTRWVNTDDCNEKEQEEYEYRDYTCSVIVPEANILECTYTIDTTQGDNGYQWVDTSATRYEDDGTVCGNSPSGDCDLQDTCLAGACVDNVVAADTECRAPAGVCDLAEVCDGSTHSCPTDSFLPDTTVCREQDGNCDVEEKCTGTGALCPDDLVQPNTFECRASAGICDVADYCDGSTKTCSSDVFKPNTEVCRASVGECDLDDYCTGSSAECSADAKSTALCRADAGECDVAEYCDGSNYCPDDAFEQPGTACGDASDTACDNPDTCDGYGYCLDNHEPIMTLCRADAGDCDLPEYCDEFGLCPSDSFEPSGTACGDPSDTVCDNPDTCDAVGNCLVNYESITTICREDAGQCDVAEYCDEFGLCPDDAFEPLSTPCDDGQWCSETDHCNGEGNCVQLTARDCSANDLPSIGSCTYSPDCNPFTWDWRDPFTSECVEDGDNTGHCTTGDLTINHDCHDCDPNDGIGTADDMCCAQCDQDTDCVQTTGYCDYNSRVYCTRDSYGTCTAGCTCVLDGWTCGQPEDADYCSNCNHCGDNIVSCGEECEPALSVIKRCLPEGASIFTCFNGVSYETPQFDTCNNECMWNNCAQIVTPNDPRCNQTPDPPLCIWCKTRDSTTPPSYQPITSSFGTTGYSAPQTSYSFTRPTYTSFQTSSFTAPTYYFSSFFGR